MSAVTVSATNTTPAVGAAVASAADQYNALPDQVKKVADAIAALLGVMSPEFNKDQIWGASALDVSKVKDYVTGLKLAPDIQTALDGLKSKAKGTPVATAINAVTTQVGTILKTFETGLTKVNDIADQAANFETIIHNVMPKLLDLFQQAGGSSDTAKTLQGGFDTAEKIFNAGEGVLRMVNMIEGCVALVNNSLQMPADS